MTLAFGLGAWRLGSHSHTSTADHAYWTEMMESMGKMHSAMSLEKPSSDADLDFVSLMLPHHQGAIDMAKTELIHGKDPQIRRLAQEIVTDQESEIQLMRHWRQQQLGANENSPEGPLSDGKTQR
jgi:uncharacterized protein (DUF305 family)